MCYSFFKSYRFFLSNRCDGFTSTFQDKMFKGYNMEIHNQIFYTTLCSCILSLAGGSQTVKFLSEHYVFVIHRLFFVFSAMRIFLDCMPTFLFCFFSSLMVGFDIWYFCLGLIIQGHLLPAVEFVYIHKDCFFDIALLSTVRKLSFFFFKSYNTVSIICSPVWLF